MTTNWFAGGGSNYALYRPDCPQALADFLAEISPDTRLAVDVGCGNGQFTGQLARHFERVIGVDPSTDQIANAVPHDHVRYVVAPAEALPLEAGTASLITAAQAAHWFDLPRFYAEVRRIAAPGALVALVSYGVPRFDADIAARFDRFYYDEIGTYWPPERKLVESGYADIDFPFPERPYPALEIRRDWDLDAFLGYLSTWSAIRRLEQAGRDDIRAAFVRDIAALWGNAETKRLVSWPVSLRLGTTP
ncbi:class I SAM-dependent methyltransferase [Sphingomonas immobilis]|uniref:Class I SAM-dependent methyltransferase n=1 Tax=Sphingomonas immobilis TaxID=3063997 RepID=A0ABT8ZVF8_9SPHN|nr:class I SAM-dependent methyltransferase [Sphingomonas sp. CA1-15]MDO7840741.1 class I SAM-dependent methyltransferase [Sphingomonas sp. CA1-15]